MRIARIARTARLERRARHGGTLIELIVVLTVGTVIIGMIATSVIAQRRTARTVATSAAGAQSVDEALHVLVSTLERASMADSVTLRSDTAVELRAMIGAALSCGVSADSVFVPDSSVAAWWETAPDTTDLVSILAPSGVWTDDEVISSRATSAPGACGVPHHAIVLRTLLPAGPVLVRFSRRVRFMLYRGSDGLWWLGQRSCAAGPGMCTSAQPIAGPLAPPPQGLSIAIDSSGSVRTASITVRAGASQRTATVAIRP